MAYFKWLFKSWLCKHSWIHKRVVHGDEINHANMRYEQWCPKCDTLRYSDKPGVKS
ncbi:hypothetical protein MIF8_51 [Erwinia phage MIF8]